MPSYNGLPITVMNDLRAFDPFCSMNFLSVYSPVGQALPVSQSFLPVQVPLDDDYVFLGGPVQVCCMRSMVCPCMEYLKLNLQGLHPSTQPQHNNGASINPQDVFGLQPGMHPFQFNAGQHGQDRQVKIQMNLAFQRLHKLKCMHLL